jgi:hypothetical protein
MTASLCHSGLKQFKKSCIQNYSLQRYERGGDFGLRNSAIGTDDTMEPCFEDVNNDPDLHSCRNVIKITSQHVRYKKQMTSVTSKHRQKQLLASCTGD